MIRVVRVSTREQEDLARELRRAAFQQLAPGVPHRPDGEGGEHRDSRVEYDILAYGGEAPIGVVRLTEQRSTRTLRLSSPALLHDGFDEQIYTAKYGLLRFALHIAERAGLERIEAASQKGVEVTPPRSDPSRLRRAEELLGFFGASAPCSSVIGRERGFSLTSTFPEVDEYVLLSHGDSFVLGSGMAEVIRGEIEEAPAPEVFAPFRKRVIFGKGDRFSPGSLVSRGQCEIACVHRALPHVAATSRPGVPSLGIAALNPYVLAHIAASLDDVGWYGYVIRAGQEPLSLTATSAALKVGGELLRSMLRYLAIAGIVRFEEGGDVYACDIPAVVRLKREIGYLHLMVQGYTPVLSVRPRLEPGHRAAMGKRARPLTS